MQNLEIEVKFLEVDKDQLIAQLQSLSALDLGEELIKEQIFHDAAKEWYSQGRFARLRWTGKGIFFTYKHVFDKTKATGTTEIEFAVAEPHKVKSFLEALGLLMDREQEKRRHKFKLGDVIVDIDSWPRVPTYVELEGPSEQAIQNTAKQLGFDWSKGLFGTADTLIREIYKIDLPRIRYFTFDRVE